MVTKKSNEPAQACVITKACPIRRGLELIEDQWSVPVLTSLHLRSKRFSEIQTNIKDVSSKMLTQTLRTLERNGLIERTVYPVVPPRVDYALTPLGSSLVPLLFMMREWVFAHEDEVQAAQSAYDQREKQAIQDLTQELVQQRFIEERPA
jgi:DNA-binding HxlR family transcriptional regulator